MGKIKSIIIVCLAMCCPFLAGSGSAAGVILREAALVSAGVPFDEAASYTDNPQNPDSQSPDSQSPPAQSNGQSGVQAGVQAGAADNSGASSPSESKPVGADGVGSAEFSSESGSETPAGNPVSPEPKRGTVITKNRSDSRDTTDYSQFTEHSGKIIRYNFGKFTSNDYITLESGAQVRNCTDVLNSTLENAAAKLPNLDIDPDKPAVLIYHTHTSESFLPAADWYDKNYPLRSSDPERSIVAVGDAICEALAKRGISSVHDCAVHDDPYTGSYYRSAETIQNALREYPSIKVVIDVHRDGIGGSDGSLAAPVATIDGKSAAQFMIISCCESEWFDMPDYLENFKLACLIQNCAEERYPTLARPILFDYRNYNQSLSTGALLIEVGSHGNSIEEAVYSGQLVGNAIADAIQLIVES